MYMHDCGIIHRSLRIPPSCDLRPRPHGLVIDNINHGLLAPTGLLTVTSEETVASIHQRYTCRTAVYTDTKIGGKIGEDGGRHLCNTF